jgi:UMF1 family MFS transporter
MSSRRAIFSWCLYDWANSAFSTVIGTFIFSVYFARGIYGDETAGSAVWGYAIGFAGLAVAVVSPVLGAVADRAGRRKPWLAAFVALTVLPVALLWFAEPSPDYVVYTVACVVLATFTFELANVFYNAMLNDIAPEDRVGRVSGWAWGAGYAGGLGCLGLALVAFVQPETPWFGVGRENAENIRITAPLVAVWFTLFAVPLFLFTPDEPRAGMRLRAAVGAGLRQLRGTLRDVRRYRAIVLFLIASALYRDGLATLFAMGGLYAAGTFAMTYEQILLFAIALNVSAGIGAAGFGWIDDWLGSRRTVMVSLVGLMAFGVPVLLVEDMRLFVALAIGLGVFVGPAQAAGRSYMARISPPAMQTEMFGLYALAGKSVAFLGPILFGLATDAFGSQRAGMTVVFLFFLAGALVLRHVPEARKPADG